MVPTIWSDFMWHTGLSGAIQSMISFVATGLLIYAIAKELKISILSRLVAVGIFVTNINILYLQSTAMTELLLICTMVAGSYYLIKWFHDEKIVNFMAASFFMMLATLIRYDGWFLLFMSMRLIGLFTLFKYGYRRTEGILILFCTLGGFAIALWLLWNLLIFGDALYFAFGPYSAHSQQLQLESAGALPTKYNLGLSMKIYLHAMIYSSNYYVVFLGFIGAIILFIDRHIAPRVRFASTALLASFFFNVLALYFGHSVLYVQGLSGNSWFNVRYGIMLIPSLAIFVAYLFDKARYLRYPIVLTLIFVLIFSFRSFDAVTVDDGRVGSSQKNVDEVSGYLQKHAGNQKGFILISAASHDAIIFSSRLPMKRFIHEGTGKYWENGTLYPDRWARWIVMRTHDDNDQTFKLVKKSIGFQFYQKVQSYPFADVYELKPQYRKNLNFEAIITDNK